MGPGTCASRSKGMKPRDPTEVVYAIIGDSSVVDLKDSLYYYSSSGSE